MADGHHRYESALAARDERPASNFVLMGILRDSDDGLNVGATHRVIHADIPPICRSGWPPASTWRTPPSKRSIRSRPAVIGLGLITASGAYLLQPTDASSAMPATVPSAWRNLAPAILQYAILEPLVGIGDQELAGGQAVSYTHYVGEAAKAVRNGGASAAFILPAATLQDVIETSDAGGFMPQKSTYFVPKLPTGVVLHALD